MARFCRLARFLGAAAGTPEVQAEKMKWAVCEKNRRWIITQNFNNITEVADAVKTLEIEDKKRWAKSEENRKRNRDDNRIITTGQSSNQNHYNGDRRNQFTRNHNNQNNQWQPRNQTFNHAQQPQPYMAPSRTPPVNRQSNNKNQNQIPVCNICGNRHQGVCRRALGACFRCGATDHMIKQCPKPDPKGTNVGNTARPTAGGRVFALNTTETSNAQGLQGWWENVKRAKINKLET
ncbi:putative transcription factor interactor and regulator CCHC(Zn) family [Helianthus annuus]|uniref:uncharacterized protein LOC110895501 n=1 Tax=Helianthus annuus TaxID=4232 RepID=UPI0016530092|nr:uncharacterized protein LOC110895501 [Helianthus annuus]XP_035836970.1 uncharacterized protein LOC110895501 [Helianthus annuus]KAJ0490196.1 putative transcription factor interactor and regulator CCHC(Zn) family [Helianthus annuus]KAJ0506114.1 putative transcription factor interactor and regulator CCHC(Zn) family [Helianthus annuus]KAJ0675785.1 putative transcription factor interactor and regulator CCHC(Zn) family [Helianthus annuus]